MTSTAMQESQQERRPVREFGLRSAFALSFADLSPIVGIYTVFAIGLVAAGPAFLWAFPLGLIYLALVAELVASAGIGILLLAFHRVNPLSVIFSGGGTAHGAHWLIGPFLLPVAYIAYSFIGFEASASVGEEVNDADRVLPKAVSLALAAGGVLVILASLGLVLAIPDLPAVLAGKDTNPIATTLTRSFGSAAGRILLVLLVIGFVSSMIAVQTAVSRATGLIALAKGLGRELGPDGILANAIAPAYIDTEQLQVDADDAGITLGQIRQVYRELVPVGRLATTADIAGAVSFLAGPGSTAFCGQILQPTGGVTRTRA